MEGVSEASGCIEDENEVGFDQSHPDAESEHDDHFILQVGLGDGLGCDSGGRCQAALTTAYSIAVYCIADYCAFPVILDRADAGAAIAILVITIVAAILMQESIPTYLLALAIHLVVPTHCRTPHARSCLEHVATGAGSRGCGRALETVGEGGGAGGAAGCGADVLVGGAGELDADVEEGGQVVGVDTGDAVVGRAAGAVAAGVMAGVALHISVVALNAVNALVDPRAAGAGRQAGLAGEPVLLEVEVGALGPAGDRRGEGELEVGGLTSEAVGGVGAVQTVGRTGATLPQDIVIVVVVGAVEVAGTGQEVGGSVAGQTGAGP